VARAAAAAALAGLLASCGGGGSDAGSDPFGNGLPDADSLAQECAMPRPGDRPGSLATEKAWLRSWIDETYLWYQDVRALPPATLDPANSATPLEYFEKLKSPLITASGKAKDEFHFTYPTPEWLAPVAIGHRLRLRLPGGDDRQHRAGPGRDRRLRRAGSPAAPQASPRARRSSPSMARTSPTARRMC
jgi:hypothetical protein